VIESLRNVEDISAAFEFFIACLYSQPQFIDMIFRFND